MVIRDVSFFSFQGTLLRTAPMTTEKHPTDSPATKSPDLRSLPAPMSPPLRWFKSRRGVLFNVVVKRVLIIAAVLCAGVLFGAYLNRYGYILEEIKVNVVVRMTPNDTLEQKNRWLSDKKLVLPETKGSQFRVPNIVHFIWFGKDKEMTFIQYTSILSAHKIQKPDVIMLHCDNLPVGKWWEVLWKEVPLQISPTQPPTEVHGQKLMHRYHQGDIAKIMILIKYGGIYLDYDVIVLSSMDPLRKFPATLGKEKPPKLIAGIIVAEKESLFLRIWLESYRNNYRPLDWDYNCARVTYKLALEKPSLVHIEPRKLTTPDWQDRKQLFYSRIDWRELYCIHIMMHLNFMEYTPTNIRTMDNTLGEILRFIYYGSPRLLK